MNPLQVANLCLPAHTPPSIARHRPCLYLAVCHPTHARCSSPKTSLRNEGRREEARHAAHAVTVAPFLLRDVQPWPSSRVLRDCVAFKKSPSAKIGEPISVRCCKCVPCSYPCATLPHRYPNLAILAPVFCLARIKGKNIIVACSQFWSGCIQQGHKKYHTTCNHMLPRAPYLDQPGSSGNTPVRAPRNPGSTAGEVDRVPPSGTFESTRGKR